MKNTSASGAKISTYISGLAVELRPDKLVGEVGDKSGQRDAAGHVVVDADHVGAQARIDRNRPGGAGEGRDIPVEVRHGSILLVGRPACAGGHGKPQRTAALRLAPI